MCLLEEVCCAVSSLCKNCVLTDFEAKRRVTEFVFYREIAQSKVEVQTQYMSGHDWCSFHNFFFLILLRRLVTVLNTFISAYVLFPCLLRAWCGNIL